LLRKDDERPPLLPLVLLGGKPPPPRVVISYQFEGQYGDDTLAQQPPHTRGRTIRAVFPVTEIVGPYAIATVATGVTLRKSSPEGRNKDERTSNVLRGKGQGKRSSH
jgi:hypothetical protein